MLIDATIVRMVLVPATMELLGDRNWWLPKWLDRILPKINVEGNPRADRPPHEPSRSWRERPVGPAPTAERPSERPGGAP